jgi:hypothetical protein
LNSREQVAHRDPRRKLPDQAECAARAGDQTEPDLGQPERRAVRGDDQVAGQGEFEAAAKCVPVNPRDHRFAEFEPLGEQRPAGLAAAAEGGRRGACVIAARPFHEVLTDREGAITGPGQHHDPSRSTASERSTYIDLLPRAWHT